MKILRKQFVVRIFLGTVNNCPTFKFSDDFQSAKLVRYCRYHPYNTSTKRWVGGDGQMLMFADMVGGWGRQNADEQKKIIKGKKDKLSFL